MTGNDVLKLAESLVDDKIATTDAVMWINMGLMDLGINARVYADTELNVAADTWMSLPDDFLAVSELLGPQLNYRVRNGQIKFSVGGDYYIHYHCMPKEINALSEHVVIHPLLKSAIAIFVAAQFKLQDDDENPIIKHLLNQYDAAVKKAVAMIDAYRQDGSMRIEVVYR